MAYASKSVTAPPALTQPMYTSAPAICGCALKPTASQPVMLALSVKVMEVPETTQLIE